MKIGIDGSRAFVSDRTGTENYSYQLLLHLSKIDKENEYLIYLRPGNRVEGEWPINFKFKILNFKFLWTQVGLALSTFTDGLDILFVPAHTLPLLRKPGLKTVMTVHDLGSEYLPGAHQLKQRLYLSFITKFQLKTASKLIAVSNSTKNDLINKIGIKKDQVEVVYEGVNEELKTVPDDLLRTVLNKFDISEKKYFLFVGTIQPRKNLTKLIEAFNNLRAIKEVDGIKETKEKKDSLNALNRLNNLKLVLVGGKGWLADEIYKLPKELGIEGKVVFAGRVSDEELSALYQGALGFTYPSLFEGFGLPVLEAFKFNCPVICSNSSSLPEVAGDGAILVNPESIDEIVKAMVKLAEDDILRDKLIYKGKEQLKKFSWEKCARETLVIFKEINGN